MEQETKKVKPKLKVYQTDRDGKLIPETEIALWLQKNKTKDGKDWFSGQNQDGTVKYIGFEK